MLLLLAVATTLQATGFVLPADIAIPPPPQSTTEMLIAAVMTFLVPILLRLWKDWQKDKAESRLQTITGMARLVYGLTEEAKRLWPDKVSSTVLFAEQKFIELLAAQGVTPTPAELTLAKAMWGNAHGLDKVQEELASAAAPVVRVAPGSTTSVGPSPR